MILKVDAFQIFQNCKLLIFSEEFLVRFVEAVTEHKMADVPLVFVTYALSKIPSQPVVAGKFLTIVR